MNCGTILYDNHFQFPDGAIIDKILIVLCEYGEDHLVLTTTSQQRNKKQQNGCLNKDNPPSFFLPQGSCWFNKNTWVELHEIHEFSDVIYKQKSEDGTITSYPDALNLALMRDILDCAIGSDYIDEYYKEFLIKMRDRL